MREKKRRKNIHVQHVGERRDGKGGGMKREEEGRVQ